MREFTRLYACLDGTRGTLCKLEALKAYFDAVPEADAAWALYFLVGRKPRRAVNTRLLREAVAEVADLPLWLVEDCYDTVGDLAETVALLHPETGMTCGQPLHRLIEEGLLPLRAMEEGKKKARLKALWAGMSRDERLVWNKFITGGFRVGVSRGLVARALAERAGVDAAVIAHRLMGEWTPSAVFFGEVLRGSDESDPGRPYPFYLASPLEKDPELMGAAEEWQVEWKWDGLRAQAIKRQGQVMLWSRGEEVMTDRFPEIAEALAGLPEGTVLDGEVLAWREEAPMTFLDLQRRIGRRKAGRKLLAEVPVIFMAFDAMEWHGADRRACPLAERRAQLARLVAEVDRDVIRLSPEVRAEGWRELAELRRQSRQRRVEGLMLKRRNSAYGAGRKRGDWWKWKIEPYEVDAVLTYARKGHGRRAGLFTDYTFGLWRDGELVTFAKAYSGLTDKEMREVDRFVRGNTVERFGPVRRVKPVLVFQIACEGIQRSSRHKSGIAVRFPRMVQWRRDKRPEEADRLAEVVRWLPE